jgi:hypothetical protein
MARRRVELLLIIAIHLDKFLPLRVLKTTVTTRLLFTDFILLPDPTLCLRFCLLFPNLIYSRSQS